MKRPGLFQGILVAGLSSLAVSALVPVVGWVVTGERVPKVVIALLISNYVVYLLWLNRARTGSVVLLVGTLLSLAVAFIWGRGAATLIVTGVGLIWAVRSLTAYSSLAMALVDGLLCLLALGAGASALGAKGSLAFAVWCFFLTQALWTLLPERADRAERREPAPDKSGSFAVAHRAAEAALRQLARR
jgi:hypothetical protein